MNALEATARRRPASIDDTAIRVAVDEWLDAHASEFTAGVGDAAAQPDAVSVASLLTRFREADGDPAALQEIWGTARKAGLLDDLLGFFQTRA